MPLPRMRFFDATGTPLAGGLVYTYAAGTTTPQATYTDSTALVSNANPVVLDAKGEADIWISGNYKVVLKDANGVQQWSEDNVADFHTIDNITATSTTSLSISTTTATRIFTTQADKFFSIGLPVFIVANGHITNNMYGQVSAYAGTQLTVAVSSGAGSGTYADWTISLSGPPGPTGSTGGSGAGSGDMLGASNLAVGAGGVANAASARTNLGLGSSATKDTGTSAGQIPLLDGNAKLPAVDGSALINLPGTNTVLLATRTASASAMLDFTEFNNAVYAYYIFQIDALTFSAAADLWMRLSTDGGSTYIASNDTYNWNNTKSGVTTSDSSTTARQRMVLATGLAQSVSPNPAFGEVKLFGAVGTAGYDKVALSHIIQNPNANLWVSAAGTFNGFSTNDSDAARFLPSSGNFTTGVIRMIGVKK